MGKSPSEKTLYSEALKALKHRVSGYTIEEKKTTYVLNPDGERVVKDEVLTTKYVAPDLNAILFVLTNLDPRQWKHKPEEKSVSADAVPESNIDLTRLSQAALDELNELCIP